MWAVTMHSNLRDHQSKKKVTYVDCYLWTSCWPQTKKYIIDIHRKKKKESKHNTKNSHQIIREESKRGREKKYLWKQIQNN